MEFLTSYDSSRELTFFHPLSKTLLPASLMICIMCLASHTTYYCYLQTSSFPTTRHSIWHVFQYLFLSQLPTIVLGDFPIKMGGPAEFLTFNILNSSFVPKTKQTHNECVFFFFSHNDLSFSFASAAQSSILNPVVWIRKMNFSASRPLIYLLPMTPALLRHQELLALHILHLPLSVCCVSFFPMHLRTKV